MSARRRPRLWSSEVSDQASGLRPQASGLGLGLGLGLLLLMGAAPDAGAPVPPPAPPAMGGGTLLLAPGATWQVSWASAPALTKQIAAVTLAGLDVAAGRREAGVAITGDDATAPAPAAWPLANRDDAVATVAPIA